MGKEDRLLWDLVEEVTVTKVRDFLLIFCSIHLTLGQKFIFSISKFSQKSHYQNPNFAKFTLSKSHFSQKFTISKPHFKQNSHF